jgi:hypothetical protein
VERPVIPLGSYDAICVEFWIKFISAPPGGGNIILKDLGINNNFEVRLKHSPDTEVQLTLDNVAKSMSPFTAAFGAPYWRHVSVQYVQGPLGTHKYRATVMFEMKEVSFTNSVNFQFTS